MKTILTKLTTIYVFLILCIYPLYYQNKYYDMGDAKMRFFAITTVLLGTVWLIAFVCYLLDLARIHRKHRTRNHQGYTSEHVFFKAKVPKTAVNNIKLSITDYFVLAYLAAVVISVLFSPYKRAVIWGFDGWYMGLVAQVCFAGIYFVVSRCWQWNRIVIIGSLVTAFVVFALAVLMRFRVDPLGMYINLEEADMIRFLSTIGQATWYSSYMVLLFPLGVFVFWNDKNENVRCNNAQCSDIQCIRNMHYSDMYRMDGHGMVIRIFSGIFTAVGFMTMVTQNSDSAFVAFGIMIFVLFWFSMENSHSFQRFLEVMILCFACFKVIGGLQKAFPERMVHLDAVSIFCSQSDWIWIFLLITIVVYLGIRRMEKHRELDISKFIFIRKIVLGIAVAGVAMAVIYICLNTAGLLPVGMRSDSNYLLLNEFWGNNRGGSWIAAVQVFLQYDIVHKLFGCGPDGFVYSVYGLFGEELITKWGQEQVLVCAHNEWLNMFVNLGVVGMAAYIGIFISAVCRFFRRTKACPVLIAVILSILCYMGHNFFCYQQIICTPIIFILIGIGEATVRHSEGIGSVEG